MVTTRLADAIFLNNTVFGIEGEGLQEILNFALKALVIQT